MTNVSIETNYGPVNIMERLKTNPSVLGSVVNVLAKAPLIQEGIGQIPMSFAIEDKIRYNDISAFKYLVEDYPFYQKTLSNVYDAVEATLPSARYKISRTINNEYRKIKGELLKNAEQTDWVTIIRANSDNIIVRVKEYLSEMLAKSTNLDNSIQGEDIDVSLDIIVGDAFVNCKILENPNN